MLYLSRTGANVIVLRCSGTKYKGVDKMTWNACSCNDKTACFLPSEFPFDRGSVLGYVGVQRSWTFSLGCSRCSHPLS